MGRVPTISLVRPTPCRDAVLPRDEALSGASRRPEGWSRLRGGTYALTTVTTPGRRQRRLLCGLCRHVSDALGRARAFDGTGRDGELRPCRAGRGHRNEYPPTGATDR